MTLVLPLMPVLVPLTTAIALFFVRKSIPAQRAIALIGTVTLGFVAAILAIAVHREGAPLAVQAGGWAAPFGITMVADQLAVILVVLTAVVALGVLIYAMGSLDERRESMGFHPLYQTLITAVCGAFLTGDIFNMYVWFEVMLLSSFVLITLGGERAQLDGAIKYVTLNLLSSSFFLTAIGLLYGTAGTLNFADLHLRLSEIAGSPEQREQSEHFLSTLSMLFLAGFGIKAALWPFFFWLPASYHTPPPVIAAVFAGLLTKVGVYSIIRTFTMVFDQEPMFVGGVILALATISMLSGVLGAASQYDFRRILAFHSVSQVGYMLMGFAIGWMAWDNGQKEIGTLALAGTIYFIFHHGIVKMNLFLVSGLVLKLKGTTNLKKLGGLFEEDAPLATVFFVTAMALAGIPILSGFWAKLALVRAGLETGHYLVIGVSLFVSVLTLFSMTKIWAEAFWKELPEDVERPEPATKATPGQLGLMFAPVASYALLAVLLGVCVGPLFDLCMQAAEGVFENTAYIEAVNPAIEGYDPEELLP
ncbi:MAG: proton-conducting transporter membrane subunit [Planctomycetota bacterium]